MRKDMDRAGNKFSGSLIKAAILTISMLHLIHIAVSLKAQVEKSNLSGNLLEDSAGPSASTNVIEKRIEQ